MGLAVNEDKLAKRLGDEFRAVLDDRGAQLVAGVLDEEKLADEVVKRVVKALQENRFHFTGTIGGFNADLYLGLERRENST